MRRTSLLGLTVLLSLVACEGEHASLGGPIDIDTNRPSSLGSIVVPSGTQTHAGKVDLLLMIDNSASMGDKQELLRRSIPDLVRRLVAPNCVDGAGNVLGQSENGGCVSGSLEFAPVNDLHVGILTSSLDGGGDACDASNPRANDRARLVNVTANGTPLPDAADGFLRFGPGGISDVSTLQSDIAELVRGVGSSGCGLEAQLESWYRFLVEPDPYSEIVITNGIPQLVGTDAAILKQRRDFLRPDSLLSIVVLTDEDDSGVDAFAVHGMGWAFASQHFPGSATVRGGQGQGTTGPRGTSACATTPLAPECTSCAYKAVCESSGNDVPGVDCAAVTSDPVCVAGTHYAPLEDELNARFFRMKQRYGIDPQYPLERYVHGLLSAKVPDWTSDHDATGKYVSAHTCDNPIYAGALPASPTDELCHLPPGPRSQKLVVLTVIAGAPPELLHPNMTASDWIAVLGKDPLAYDFTGIDPHMVQSKTPRPDLPPPTASNDADPVHGREWNTLQADLQYACTFALEEPRICNTSGEPCDCAPETSTDSPLCDAADRTKQVRAKAYPGIRPLQLARLLGDNAVASSICPRSASTAPNDPIVAYRPAMNQLGDRMARSLLPASK